MSKTFSHAGVSKLNGEFKVRFANDALRTKVLIKGGHTDIDLMELPNPMSKEDAIAYLLSIDFATDKFGVTNQAVHEAILAEVDKRAEKPAKVKAEPSMEAIEAKVAAKKAKVTPQVPALEGMTPLGIKPTAPKSTVTRAEVEAQLKDIEDAPF
jgi:hypothetical protein